MEVTFTKSCKAVVIKDGPVTNKNGQTLDVLVKLSAIKKVCHKGIQQCAFRWTGGSDMRPSADDQAYSPPS